MAEAFLRDRLQRRGVDAHVHSAGLLDAGRPASAHGVAILRDLGLDLSAHRSRAMESSLLLGADLIVGMAREHVREAVVLAPAAWPRAFTLKELVRRGEGAGSRPAHQSFEEWLSACHSGRTHTGLLGDDEADDVADPYGSSRSQYERTATELQRLVDRFVDLAFPPHQETRQ